MFKKITTLLAACATLCPAIASASDHYFFIRENTRRTTPLLEVSSLEPTDLNVQVFGSPGGFTTASCAGSTLFASVDLRQLAHGGLKPGEVLLGRATSTEGVSTSAGVLTDDEGFTVPPIHTAAGPAFLFPVGDVSDGVSLLVGNFNGGPMTVNLTAAGPTQPFTVEGNSALEIPLTAGNTGYALSAYGTVGTQLSFIAALLRHTKHDPQIAMLLPLTT
jgi:hypothetical protein